MNLGYTIALWSLVLLFCLRVTGQLLQFFSPFSWLPLFEKWQGSSLPYWLLLLIQLLIIVIMVRTVRRYTSGGVQKNHQKGKWLLAIGGVYFTSMAIRLIIGLSDLSAAPWFHKSIPAFFHLVLASFVLLLGAFHMNWVNRKI